MRFDRWFKYMWTINLGFLVFSLASAAVYLLTGALPIMDVLADPFSIKHVEVFPAPVVFLFFLPFFLSSNLLVAMGAIEVYTSRKPRLSKMLWIFPMVAFGAIITVVYYFFGGRKGLTK